VSFWCRFLILFLAWFPHRVFFGFGGFFGALLDAFVGFGSPFGDHFALIFRSLNVACPDMIFALICDRFLGWILNTFMVFLGLFFEAF
jgi:hypothetical protein